MNRWFSNKSAQEIADNMSKAVHEGSPNVIVILQGNATVRSQIQMLVTQAELGYAHIGSDIQVQLPPEYVTDLEFSVPFFQKLKTLGAVADIFPQRRIV